jgi:hypothetical protein
MHSKRYTVEQIVAKLREAEKLQAQGLTIPGVPPLSWTPERLARLGRAGGWCSCQSGGSTRSRKPRCAG